VVKANKSNAALYEETYNKSAMSVSSVQSVENEEQKMDEVDKVDASQAR
jgi:hypothetical protein